MSSRTYYGIQFDLSKTKTNDIKFIETVAKYRRENEILYSYYTSCYNRSMLAILYKYLRDFKETVNNFSYTNQQELLNRRREALGELRDKKLFTFFLSIDDDDRKNTDEFFELYYKIIDSIDSTTMTNKFRCTEDTINDYYDKLCLWYEKYRITDYQITCNFNIEKDVKEALEKKKKESNIDISSIVNGTNGISIDQIKNLSSGIKEDTDMDPELEEVYTHIREIEKRIFTRALCMEKDIRYTFSRYSSIASQLADYITEVFQKKGYRVIRDLTHSEIVLNIRWDN